MKAIVGIDVGVHGALALVAQENDAAPTIVDVIDIPVVGSGAKERVNVLLIQEWLLRHKPLTAFLERTQAFPLQGRSSAFKFGRATGALEAVITLCAIPLEIIEPSIWKRYFHLPGKDKEAARLRSITLFPAAHQLFARKRDHQRSEAVLIALYGLRIPQPVTRTHDETPTASNAAVAEDTLIALTVNKGDAP